MTAPTIEATGLTKRFGNFTALDHLELKLEGAKCVGFLGPNGAGKTTTLKMLTDMIFPTAGECFINGISVQAERKVALADAGVLIESPEIYPSLTPRQALQMIADLRGLPARDTKGRIDEVLSEVKMADWADKRVGRFSKGMKQRINIAAALVHDPDVVILDEPATGLDPRGMAEVRDIVRGLKKRNRLIFMSSHILQEVVDVCDEVALIDKGKLLFYDTLANVTSKFAGGNPTIDVGLARPLGSESALQDIGALPGVTSCTLLEPKRIRLRFNGGPDGREQLLASLVELRIGVTSLSEPVSALEEIYLKQIEKGD
ncbi:MAG: ABC transporter ATP-binding protein [Euryarchaeota archaeon]|nr:ABC transporter ATP-binding protein [Euryarchaeota archaeon]MDE1835608.1 ABC transporter ATP-binding protein [Euryarchaeota archaeon]MDE1878956.1 ABC transporter ATP-binding protein [Euryarchaeota archaeon]MDE2043770.1 ABC transporter ATP-binding protein [Thermoplasmata archaeon]